MSSKKEKLKFYRLPVIDIYKTTDIPTNKIRGYRNKYSDFSKYSDIYLQDGVNIFLDKNEGEVPPGSWIGPAPEEFFAPKTKKEFENLEFVIDGTFEAYDRSKHNLDKLSAKIYILETTKDGTFGTPYNNKTAPKKLYESRKDVLTHVTFWVNPTNIKIRKKKFFQKLRTRAGWAFQHWGPDVGEIILTGTTGNITPPPKIQVGKIAGLPILPQVVEEKPTENNSPALKGFRKIEQWYDEDQNDEAQSASVNRLTAVEFRGRIYVGHFIDFSFEERGEFPFQLFYQLRFMVHYDAGSLSAATTRRSKQIVRNEETLRKVLEMRNNNNG